MRPAAPLWVLLPALVLLPFQLALLWSIIAEDKNALVDVRCGNYIRALF